MRCAVMLLLAACSASDDFPAPQIASVSPQSAAPGSSVLISGNYFCHQTEEDGAQPCTVTGAVYFGSTLANTLQYEETSIMAEVPDGMGTSDITISVAGEHSNAVSFTFE